MKSKFLVATGIVIAAGGAITYGILGDNGENKKIDVCEDRSAVSSMFEAETSEIISDGHPRENLNVVLISGTPEEYQQRVNVANERYHNAQENFRAKARVYANKIDRSQADYAGQEDTIREELNQARQAASTGLAELHNARSELLDELCEAGIIQRGNNSMCLTTKTSHKRETHTVNTFRKVLYCDDPVRVVDEPKEKEKDRKGIILAENLKFDVSMNGIWNDYDRALVDKCCKNCKDSCWVVPGSHGACPSCLCDNSCDNHCQGK